MGNLCSGSREASDSLDSSVNDASAAKNSVDSENGKAEVLKKEMPFVVVSIDPSLEIEDLPDSSKQRMGTIEQGFSCLNAKHIESISDKRQIITSKECGFVHAVYLAFNHHIPLCFGPDDLWNLIIQGVSKHIEKNAEKLRDKFVDFDGKKMLMITRNSFIKGHADNDWAGCFEEWSQQITENIGEDNTKNFIPSFSTTGPLEKAVHELSLMDCMKSYFEYGMRTLCGISKVKLLGSLEDWKQLRNMLTNLRQYELDWWMDAIEPVVDMIIKTYTGELKGEESKKFWYSIYKKYSTHGSGASTYVTGWITNFFPYNCNGSQRYGFATLEYLMNEDKDELRGWGPSPGSIDHNYVPNGVLACPFTWFYYEEQIPMKIYGGFAGCEMDEDNFIRPVLAWAVGPNGEARKENKLSEFVKKNGPIEKWKAKVVAKWLIESDSVFKLDAQIFKNAGVTGKDFASAHGRDMKQKLSEENFNASYQQWTKFREEMKNLGIY